MKEISVTAAEFILSLTVLVTSNEIASSETLENALEEFTRFDQCSAYLTNAADL